MPNIFLSYRRDDSLPWTGRLHDHFARHFGAEHVFVDIDSIEPGEDFSDVVRRRIEECDVFVPVIGRNWMTIADANGKRRLEDQDDYVRMEIATALSRRKRIVPVVVGGARMPEKRDLPSEIAALATRNGVSVDDLRFAEDVRRLILMLERVSSSVDAKREELDIEGKAEQAVGTKPVWEETGNGDLNREYPKRQTKSGGRSPSRRPVAWIVGGVAAAILTVLVAGRILPVKHSAVRPEPTPSSNEVSTGGFFDPRNSPTSDLEVMKLKRIIDANQQNADLERIGDNARANSVKPNLVCCCNRSAPLLPKPLECVHPGER